MDRPRSGGRRGAFGGCAAAAVVISGRVAADRDSIAREYVTDFEITFTIGDQTTELAAGHLLYVPTGVRHAVRGVVDASVLLTIRL